MTRAPQVVHGDCLEIMKMLPDNSVDSIVTDPPYGLGFMGKAWDALPPGEDWAIECLRVLKPGGHLLAFGGTRTWHRLAVAVEDAGFEIRDSIAWMYGSGFPKSHDVSKAIDRAAGASREVIGSKSKSTANSIDSPGKQREMGYRPEWRNERLEASTVTWDITAPATPAAQQWQGWGTALKPAFEPIVFARKPLIGTVAANVQTHGTGALNIDACRIATDGRPLRIKTGEFSSGSSFDTAHSKAMGEKSDMTGRWPANVALDEHMAAVLDEQSGDVKGNAGGTTGKSAFWGEDKPSVRMAGYGDHGGASRFFKVAEADEHGAISPHFPREFDAFMYSPKAPKKERPVVDNIAHATVKPLSLMRWLVRLVTPAGGTVLEPFAGSGTTVEACILEGFHCIAIEREAEYLPLIQARIERQEVA